MSSPPADTSTLLGWSPGTTGTNSTRFAIDEPALTQHGVTVANAEANPPFAGTAWMKKFFPSPPSQQQNHKLSISDKLVTDREWSAGRTSTVIVKGWLDFEVVKSALEEDGDEDILPVACFVGKNKKALASIWVNDVQDSVCGAYHEYVVSLDVFYKTSDPTNDTQQQPRVAFSVETANDAIYSIWYNQFSKSICQAQYLHSLYINSPLSISWGREMQAFPKHPVPVISKMSLVDNKDMVKNCEISWSDKKEKSDEDEVIFKMSTVKQFGVLGFCKEAWGLLRSVGMKALLSYLAAAEVTQHIIMPQKTAAQNQCERHYTGHIWKGLLPTAVQVWSWNPETDTCLLGAFENATRKSTNAESNNGLALLQRGNFEPVSVCGLDQWSCVVASREKNFVS